jgi:glycogen(starch) synthase
VNVVLYHQSFDTSIGGGEQVIQNLARIFATKGHRVTVITVKLGDSVVRETIHGIEVVRLPHYLYSRRPRDFFQFAFNFIPIIYRLRQLIKEKEPDIVNLHFIWRYALYPLVLSHFVNFPFVVSLHGSDVHVYPQGSAMDRVIFISTLRRADYVTTNSKNLLNRSVRVAPYVKEKSFVTRNGVNLREFDTKAAFDHGRPYVLAIGRFDHKKGFDILIKAFRLVLDQVAYLDLIIAGDGPEWLKNKELAADLGLSDRVHLIGWTDRPTTVSLFNSCEFFVLPSRMEAFGIANLEAMASGKAIAATKVGGVAELVTHGVNGVLVEPNDIESLAKNIIYLHKNRELRELMGKNGRELVERNYTWEHIAEGYLEVYKKAQERRF